MEPFHFQSGHHELMGIYHPPADPASRRGVLLCPPQLTDHTRSYRCLSELAMSWASAGYHVLRFDYSGVGDSAGDWHEFGPKNWIADIVCAYRELEEISGADDITMAGVRFGGLLSLEAAIETNPRRIVLWDPVVQGGDYLADLNRLHNDLVSMHSLLTANEVEKSKVEICGFPRPGWMDTELSNLNLRSTLPESVEFVRVVKTTTSEGLDALRSSWSREQRELTIVASEFECAWGKVADEILNAAPVIRELSLWR